MAGQKFGEACNIFWIAYADDYADGDIKIVINDFAEKMDEFFDGKTFKNSCSKYLGYKGNARLVEDQKPGVVGLKFKVSYKWRICFGIKTNLFKGDNKDVYATIAAKVANSEDGKNNVELLMDIGNIEDIPGAVEKVLRKVDFLNPFSKSVSTGNIKVKSVRIETNGTDLIVVAEL